MDAAPLPSFDQNHDIDPANVPVHVACVMDGNGRWAAQRGLTHKDGHMAGEQALSDVVEGSIEIGVQWLTAYAFSTENWTRPTDEVEFLMQFNEDVIARRSGELHEQGVRLIFAGRRGFPIPESVGVAMDEAMKLTAGNDRLTLTVAFNYGGRAEIVDAVRSLVASGVAADDIDEAAIRSHLYVPDMPDVDLLIRTSNEFRISNFLLWEVAYGELYFTETLWPDFDRQHLFAAVREFQGRNRRFGGR
jgi:undecaprenyl diphosphate synthase